MPSACARWSGRCHSSTPADASSPSDITDRAGRPPADGKLRPPQWRCSRIVPILPENDPFRSFSRPGQTISSLTQPALRSQKRHSAHASVEFAFDAYCQAFTAVLIQNVQRSEDFSIISSVMNKVIGPDVVAVLWPQSHA